MTARFDQSCDTHVLRGLGWTIHRVRELFFGEHIHLAEESDCTEECGKFGLLVKDAKELGEHGVDASVAVRLHRLYERVGGEAGGEAGRVLSEQESVIVVVVPDGRLEEKGQGEDVV